MRTIRTPEKREVFLEALRQGYSIAHACRQAAIGRTAAYEWRNDDPAFAAEWDAAESEGSDVLEDEARRRAVEGVVTEKRIASKDGESVETAVRIEYSDTLLIFLLKGRRPEKYRERYEAKHVGEVTHTHEVDWSGLTDDELDLLAGIAVRAARPAEDPTGAGAA